MQRKILKTDDVKETISGWLSTTPFWSDKAEGDISEDEDRVNIIARLNEQEIRIYIRAVKEMQNDLFEIFNWTELGNILGELEQQETHLANVSTESLLRTQLNEIRLQAAQLEKERNEMIQKMQEMKVTPSTVKEPTTESKEFSDSKKRKVSSPLKDGLFARTRSRVSAEKPKNQAVATKRGMSRTG